MRYKNIIWDWNGTLFDDIDACMASMDELLERYGLAKIGSKARYKSIFGFPVQEYYSKLGFDFSVTPFETLAHEYIALYEENQKQSKLFSGASGVLEEIKNSGIDQHIISASKQQTLLHQMSRFGIIPYFTSINGLQDDFAVSKADIAKALVLKIGRGTVFVGDTIHDWEVADAAGCPCILIANGHQDKQRLIGTSATVIDNIDQLVENLIQMHQ